MGLAANVHQICRAVRVGTCICLRIAKADRLASRVRCMRCRCILPRRLRSTILEYPRLLRASANMQQRRLQADVFGWHHPRHTISRRRNTGELGIKWNTFTGTGQWIYNLDAIGRWSKRIRDTSGQYPLRLVWESQHHTKDKSWRWCRFGLHPPFGRQR